MPQPSPEQEISPPNAVPRHPLRHASPHHPLHLPRQLRRHPLICIQQKHPRMPKRNDFKCRIPMRRIVVEPPLIHRRPPLPSHLPRPIRAHRVKHMHVIAPRHRIEAARQVRLLIPRKNQNRDHPLLIPAAAIASTWRDPCANLHPLIRLCPSPRSPCLSRARRVRLCLSQGPYPENFPHPGTPLPTCTLIPRPESGIHPLKPPNVSEIEPNVLAHNVQ